MAISESANVDNLHVQTELKNKNKSIKQYQVIVNKLPKTETK